MYAFYNVRSVDARIAVALMTTMGRYSRYVIVPVTSSDDISTYRGYVDKIINDKVREPVFMIGVYLSEKTIERLTKVPGSVYIIDGREYNRQQLVDAGLKEGDGYKWVANEDDCIHARHNPGIYYFQANGLSMTELVWTYLCNKSPAWTMRYHDDPLMVKYMSAVEWNTNEYGRDSEDFRYGIDMMDYAVDDKAKWNALARNSKKEVEYVTSIGRGISLWREETIKSIMDSISYTCVIDEHEIVVVNSPFTDIGACKDHLAKHDAVAVFYHHDGKVTCFVYTVNNSINLKNMFRMYDVVELAEGAIRFDCDIKDFVLVRDQLDHPRYLYDICDTKLIMPVRYDMEYVHDGMYVASIPEAKIEGAGSTPDMATDAMINNLSRAIRAIEGHSKLSIVAPEWSADDAVRISKFVSKHFTVTARNKIAGITKRGRSRKS